jgi:hypothetical protein
MLACHKEYCSASMTKIVQADSGLSYPLRDHTGYRMRPSENSILPLTSVNRPSSDAVLPTRETIDKLVRSPGVRDSESTWSEAHIQARQRGRF